MKTRPLHPRGRAEFYRRVIPLLIVCILLASGGCGEGSKPGGAETQRPAVTAVRTDAIASSVVDDVYEATGTVRPDRTGVLASRIMGAVTALYVNDGDRVKAGQLLMTIDSRDLAQKVKGASMGLETAKQHRDLAETTWRRYVKLHEEKALSQQEMDQVETHREVAESEYERAKAALGEAAAFQGYSQIRAPFAGTVRDRKIQAGGMAVPGQPLLTLDGAASFYVECFVDEALSGRIRKDMPVEVVIEAVRRTLRGAVRDVVAAVDPQSRSFLVKIGLPPEGLKSGLFARVRIPVGKREALLVPEGALVHRGQLTGVFAVAPDGVVTYRLVKAGRSHPDGRIEILSGLRPSDEIIIEGAGNAVDGGILRKR